MSDSYRDQRGGHYGKHAWRAGDRWPLYAKRAGRRSARAQARRALQLGQQPPPMYPIERQYLD